MPIARNPRLKALKELATAVGARIKVEYTGVGQGEYVLLDKDGEPLVREYDTFDMLDSIRAYYGGHPNYAEARAQFNYMTGEDA
jgi:MoaA/NifB/PqqE/SkfB family radical SAM enzyme